MEERLLFVARLIEGEVMTDLAREFGVSRKTGYKIFSRYKEHGLEALTDRSRRPVRYANQPPAQIEALIVRLKQEKPHWGARKIRELLLRRLPGDVRLPAKSTIHDWGHRGVTIEDTTTDQTDLADRYAKMNAEYGTNLSAPAPTQRTRTRTIVDGTRVVTIDLETGRAIGMTVPGQREPKTNVLKLVRARLSGERGSFLGHACDYWVLPGPFDARICITPWGATLYYPPRAYCDLMHYARTNAGCSPGAQTVQRCRRPAPA